MKTKTSKEKLPILNINYVKRLEQPGLIELIDKGQLILANDLEKLTQTIKELDYVLVKKEDYDIMSDESRELAYMKLEQAGVLDKNRRSI